MDLTAVGLFLFLFAAFTSPQTVTLWHAISISIVLCECGGDNKRHVLQQVKERKNVKQHTRSLRAAAEASKYQIQSNNVHVNKHTVNNAQVPFRGRKKITCMNFTCL